MRYMRVPGGPYGSATKRSAVMAGAADVAAGQGGAGDVHLAGYAGGHCAQAGVQDVHAGARHGGTDHHGLAGFEVGGGGVDGGLARPVRVDDPAARRAEPLDQLGGAGLAADGERTQVGQSPAAARAVRQQHRGGRRQEHVGDAGVPQPGVERVTEALVVAGDVQLGARDPGEEQVGHGDVEAEGDALQDAVLGGDGEGVAHGSGEVGERPVLDGDALGDAGGAGGEQDVGEVVGGGGGGRLWGCGGPGGARGVGSQARDAEPLPLGRGLRSRQQQPGAGGLGHVREAGVRVGPVQRNVRAARAQTASAAMPISGERGSSRPTRKPGRMPASRSRAANASALPRSSR